MNILGDLKNWRVDGRGRGAEVDPIQQIRKINLHTVYQIIQAQIDWTVLSYILNSTSRIEFPMIDSRNPTISQILIV